jgi:GNAT superfamily N-acetyltransferase
MHEPASNLSVRRACVGDARAIAEVAVRGWQAAYRGTLPDDFLDGLSVVARETGWRELLERDTTGQTPAWLAEREARVLGFVSSGPPRDEDVPLPAAEVYAIYVLPEAWRSGLGRGLLETATQHWREQGAVALVLWVLEANEPARAFYAAQGWQPDGSRRQFELAGLSAPEVRYRLRLQPAPDAESRRCGWTVADDFGGRYDLASAARQKRRHRGQAE